jgi:hypothetical protein
MKRFTEACGRGHIPTGASTVRILIAIAAAVAMLVPAAQAADHDDTPALKAAPRHEARITDLHVFSRVQPGPGRKAREQLVLSLCTNPTIPPEATSYTFPSDLTLTINVDRTSKVDFLVDPVATSTYGGTIVKPAAIDPEITFTITFDAGGQAHLVTSGLDEDAPIRFFSGLRDDPFIRGPRQGRNVGCVVLEMPLQIVAAGKPHKTLLVWATSSVPAPGGPIGDLGARALRSQLAPNLALNDYFNPADHTLVLGVVPDVVIFDTTRAATFPNGRRLTDDVVDLVGDPGVLSTDCPAPGDPVKCFPMSNDSPFLESFPYLAPPHPAP